MIVTVTPNPVLDRTLTVPRIAFNDVIRATAVRLDWGGKGFNVSRALKALGLDSVALGFVGGATGQMLEQGLNELGIATDFVHIAGETRTNIVIAETAGERHIKVNETGPTVSEKEITAFFQRASDLVQPDDLWALCGSLPPGVPADFYAGLIELLRERGARVALDTSGEALRLGSAAGPFLAKPNAAEAEELTGLRVDGAAAAVQASRWFLERGIELVALSLGEQGLVLSSGRETVWARPPAVRVGNPTGAGDALLAGIIWALAKGLPLPELARWGVAAGTAAAQGEGVSVGTRAEVAKVYGQTRVVRL